MKENERPMKADPNNSVRPSWWSDFLRGVDADMIDPLIDVAMKDVCETCVANDPIIVIEVTRTEEGHRFYEILTVIDESALTEMASCIGDVDSDMSSESQRFLEKYKKLRSSKTAMGRIVLILSNQFRIFVFRCVERIILSPGGQA